MADQRLPTVNSDDGVWGDELNNFLGKEHYNADTNYTSTSKNGGHKTITIQPGTATAGTAPLKFTAGTLLTTAEAGAVEFNADKLYVTTSTPTRKTLASYDDTSGATGDMYYRDVSGNFIRLPLGSSGQSLVVNSGIPSWQTTFSGMTKLSVGTTAPTSPATGDLWVDTT
jgi:hypothetical protein